MTYQYSIILIIQLNHGERCFSKNSHFFSNIFLTDYKYDILTNYHNIIGSSSIVPMLIVKYSVRTTFFRSFWGHWSRKWGSFFTKIRRQKFRSTCWCVTSSWILTRPFLKLGALNLLRGTLCMHLNREHCTRFELFFSYLAFIQWAPSYKRQN